MLFGNSDSDEEAIARNTSNFAQNAGDHDIVVDMPSNPLEVAIKTRAVKFGSVQSKWLDRTGPMGLGSVHGSVQRQWWTEPNRTDVDRSVRFGPSVQ